jgi:uncharacterized protein
MTSPGTELGHVERDERSAAFFDAAAEGRLLVHRCRTCGHLYGPEINSCTACSSEDVEWHEVSGSGTVVSWVAVHRPPRDGAGGAARRSIVALVELTEGPWLTLPVDVPAGGELAVGEPVKVGFVRPPESEAIPVCVPITSG